MLMDIGLEVHAELLTESKMFCSCSSAFGAEPNANCCPVCLGLPGTMPLLNERVPALAVRAGLALGCQVSRVTSFDRKNFFYPDLPKGFQISQLYFPICTSGALPVETDSGVRKIAIRELHMEDDAGKLIHKDGVTYADYNRCGVPLIEIVTEPDMHSPEEAAAFVRELIGLLTYAGISDCRMQEGSLRVDVNLSVRENKNAPLGIRTEMKNLGSIRAVSRAVRYEAKRQVELISAGMKISRETRRWDEEKEITVALREKEETGGYRYFPEPDIPPLSISEEFIENERQMIPELPMKRRSRYMSDWGISRQDSYTLTAEKYVAEFFEYTVRAGVKPAEAAKWICADLLRIWKTSAMGKMSPKRLAALIHMTNSGVVSRATAREMLIPMHQSELEPQEYAASLGLGKVSAKKDVETAVNAVLAANSEKVLQYKSGKDKLWTYLFGKVMKELGGKGEPTVISAVLKELIEKEK